MGELAKRNTLNLWTAWISSPFHRLGQWRAELEDKDFVYDIKECVWRKVTQYWQELANIPGASCISNCEAALLVFCKKPELKPEIVQQMEANFYPASDWKWLCHHPLLSANQMRATCFDVPIQDKKVEDPKKGTVNKSEKSTAEGEHAVNICSFCGRIKAKVHECV